MVYWVVDLFYPLLTPEYLCNKEDSSFLNFLNVLLKGVDPQIPVICQETSYLCHPAFVWCEVALCHFVYSKDFVSQIAVVLLLVILHKLDLTLILANQLIDAHLLVCVDWFCIRCDPLVTEAKALLQIVEFHSHVVHWLFKALELDFFSQSLLEYNWWGSLGLVRLNVPFKELTSLAYL